MSPANDEDFRKYIQSQIQRLLGGERPRNPHLSQLTTGRLLLEGIIEAVQSYRLHMQEKVQRREDERKQSAGRMIISGQHRHGHRPRSRHRHRHRDESTGVNRHKVRHRDGHGTKERSRSRSRSRSRRRHRYRRNLHNPVTEGRPSEDPLYQTSGGAGAQGPLAMNDGDSSLTPEHDQHPPSALDQAAVHEHPEQETPRRRKSRSKRQVDARHVGSSTPPTHRKGPDGTPFGQLPVKKGDLLSHSISVYKHIKAEQEANHRPKGMLERSVDGWMTMALKAFNRTNMNDGQQKDRPMKEKPDRPRRHKAHDNHRRRRKKSGKDHDRGDPTRDIHDSDAQEQEAHHQPVDT